MTTPQKVSPADGEGGRVVPGDEPGGVRRAGEPPPLPWLAWKVGDRVVVRYLDDDGRRTDALGPLTAVTAAYVEVDTKRGNVRVPAERMITGKLVPPAPQFPPAP